MVLLFLLIVNVGICMSQEQLETSGNYTGIESIDNSTSDSMLSAEMRLEDMKKMQKMVDELRGKGYVQVCDGTLVPNHMIYCSGGILAAVNMHRLYKDSKTFVDMPLKEEPYTVFTAFNNAFNTSELYKIDVDKLRKFIDKYFLPPSTNELEECELQDWQSHPPEIMKIKDVVARTWALELNAYWKKLCRKVKPLNSNRHSIISIPNEFIVPGGRFREFYYWDTYWIVKGLLVCGMTKTVEKILGNFEYLVSKYGFIPNGGRIYYLRRSQPPMFAHMVYDYYKKTGKINKGLVDSIARELYFWKNYRAAKVSVVKNTFGRQFETTQELFKYFTPTNVPRPESFFEDIEVAKRVPESKRKKLYSHLASTAESGWDFSSRFLQGGSTLEYTITTDIVPLDLNAYVCGNMKILKILTKALNNTEGAGVEDIKKAMYAVLYDEKNAIWQDYNEANRNFSNIFYASLSALLYTECYSPLPEEAADQVVKYLKEKKLLSFAGGIPTSMVKNTELQWDYPNNFPLLQHMFIMGLYKSHSEEARNLAYEIAHNWVERIYSVYRRSGKMWEKYDLSKPFGVAGTGGEYGVQSGYGFTNAAILDLLTTYPDSLWLQQVSFPNETTNALTDAASRIFLEFRTIILLATLVLLYNYNRYTV